MEKHAQDIYLREVRQHAKYIKLAKSQLERALEQTDAGVDDGVFMSLQTLLSSAAMLSKLFWPPGDKVPPARGPHLRELLGVGEESPLRNRRLRDHFEHYDERIDAYAASGQRIHIDRNVGPADMFGAIPSEMIHRHYDPLTEVVSFRGDEFNIGPLVEAAAQLTTAAHALLPEGEIEAANRENERQ